MGAVQVEVSVWELQLGSPITRQWLDISWDISLISSELSSMTHSRCHSKATQQRYKTQERQEGTVQQDNILYLLETEEISLLTSYNQSGHRSQKSFLGTISAYFPSSLPCRRRRLLASGQYHQLLFKNILAASFFPHITLQGLSAINSAFAIISCCG